jgi:hypothetical protein
VNADLNAGVKFAKFGEGREQGVDGAFVNAEREFAAFEALKFGEALFDFVAEVDESLGVVLQEGSSVGEADGAGAANDEWLAKGVLELADGQADGGLSAVKALGSAREAAFFRHHEKDLKFAEVQGMLLGGSIS